MKLSKLKQIELRKVWAHEALDFTRWLALPDNMALLSETIGIGLTASQTEVSVGSFNLDILAEEENTGRKVIIENQLESTDHDHLGKLVTYASGLQAQVVIWIVKDVREEHEQAVSWLNEHTDENLNFFIIRMELWQIGESEIAPKFTIVVKPNDWAKTVRQSSRGGEVTEYKLQQQRFWSELAEYGASTTNLRYQTPRPQHWYNISIGTSDAHISLTVNRTEGVVGCELYIPRDEEKEIFDALYTHKAEIEAELGLELDWMRLDEKRASRLRATSPGAIESEDWKPLMEWLVNTAQKFRVVFPKYLKR